MTSDKTQISILTRHDMRHASQGSCKLIGTYSAVVEGSRIHVRLRVCKAKNCLHHWRDKRDVQCICVCGQYPRLCGITYIRRFVFIGAAYREPERESQREREDGYDETSCCHRGPASPSRCLSKLGDAPLPPTPVLFFSPPGVPLSLCQRRNEHQNTWRPSQRRDALCARRRRQALLPSARGRAIEFKDCSLSPHRQHQFFYCYILHTYTISPKKLFKKNVCMWQVVYVKRYNKIMHNNKLIY